MVISDSRNFRAEFTIDDKKYFPWIELNGDANCVRVFKSPERNKFGWLSFSDGA